MPRSRLMRTLLVVLSVSAAAFALCGPPASAGTSIAGVTRSGRTSLSVRDAATTLAPRTGALRTNSRIAIVCQVVGSRVRGTIRTTNRWDRLPDGRYVSDAYVQRARSVKTCPTLGTLVSAPYPAVIGSIPIGTWVRPLARVYRATQGFRTPALPRHDGEDLMAPRGIPIRAAAAGVVITVSCNASTYNCDVDGSRAIRGCGWYAEIRHVAGVVTRYCHMLRAPAVRIGQTVAAGAVIGLVGTSGHSSAPHLHFEVHSGVPATPANAVDPIAFMRRAGASIG